MCRKLWEWLGRKEEPKMYQFADISHHKGDLDIQVFANKGHRLVVSKASDNYHLPDINGKYDFSADRHYDSRFVQNFVNTRSIGLVALGYHFCRWDRPLPLSNKAQIVEKNLEYFQIAVNMLPAEHQAEVKCVVLDMEQSGSQLAAAGLSRSVVSRMAEDMVMLFLEHYESLILYAGSWWTNEWLEAQTTEWMAERMAVWEPEYIIQDGSIIPPNEDYLPSVPTGFSNEYVVSMDNFIGNMFAWQFTSKGNFFGVNNIDTNQYQMQKEELYKLSGQDSAVDPLDPPGTGIDKNAVYSDFNRVQGMLDDVQLEIDETMKKYE